MENVSSRESSITTTARQKIGAKYEQLACNFLQAKGLSLIAKNSYCQFGELDLIMRDGEYWVFIEVRYRRFACYGDAQSTIDKRKQRKIVCSAINWLQSQSINIDDAACRFDVFAITGNEINWIIDAFGQDIILDR